MSSVSPRLGLELPDTGDSMKKGDSVLASNYRLLDKNTNIRYEADLASIVAPYTGQFALDTDVDEVKFYDAGWKYFGFAGVPRGQIFDDFDTTEGSDAPPAGTASKVFEAEITIVTGRRYSLTIGANLFPSTATTYAPIISVKTSTVATVVGDTDLCSNSVSIIDGTIGSAKAMTYTYVHYFTAADVGTGTRFFGIWLDTNDAAATTTWRTSTSSAPHYSAMVIEDVGAS